MQTIKGGGNLCVLPLIVNTSFARNICVISADGAKLAFKSGRCNRWKVLGATAIRKVDIVKGSQ